MLPALFALVIYEIESLYFPRLPWTTILLFVLPMVAGMTGIPPHRALSVEMGSPELFAQAGLKLQSSGS
jgi:uncharacterized membrane protein YdbT with pleckstrin-like domain